MTDNRPGSGIRVIPIMIFAAGCIAAFGLPQSGLSQAVGAGASAHQGTQLAFEVVSIRQNPSPPHGPRLGPTADGYRMTGVTLLFPIMTAYTPTSGATAFMPNQIKGLPDWAMRETYDIDAKVSNEDLAAWQKPASQKEMLQVMMQALLQDRCKILAHQETKEAQVFFLTVVKNGPKFKETDPTADHPKGTELPFGGVMVPSADGFTLYDASMASLATMLSGIGGQTLGRPIQDKTGLTAHYDIAVKRPDMGPSPGDAGSSVPPDPASMIFSLVESLGLKLESGKETTDTLVIDHIEQPSPN